MATPGAPEEIFRFTIVRNPEPAAPEALEDGVIPVVADASERTHPYYTSLLQLARQRPSRDNIVAYAEKILAGDVLAKLNNLQTAILRFGDRLGALQKPTVESTRRLLQDTLGEVSTSSLESDRAMIADALILVAIARPPVAGVRGRLMRGLRAVEVARRIEAEEMNDVTLERLARATLLLPADLFPLPSNDAAKEANQQAYEARKAQLEGEKKRAQGVLDKMAQNAAAIDELSSSLTTHLFDSRDQVSSNDKPATRAVVLPEGRVRKLSAATRKVIVDDLTLSETNVDVPFAVEQLESRNARLGQELTANFGDFLLEAAPFNLPGCGECKPVVLSTPKPGNDFTPETRGKVELVGIQDLLIVRQKLREYRAGEIAHIENVLKGERKAKKHRKLHRSETTIVQEKEREEETEDELQTTDKYELQTESSRTIQEDKSMEAGLTVTATYGAVNIEAHGNYASATSTSESRASASRYARDVVNRSLHKIRERVLTRRTQTDISEVEVINEHEFNNIDGEGHVNGVYRWVDKFYEAQIVNYGKRTMLEFMIPEPAAFYRHAITKKPSTTAPVPKPEMPGFCRNGVFHPLTPSDLQPENYLCFVGKYRVSDVAPPPARYLRVSDVVKYKQESTAGNPIVFAEANDSFKIPEGYTPRAVTYTISGGNSHSATSKHDDHDDIIMAVVTIGTRKAYRFYKSEIGKANGEDYWEDLTQVIEWGGRPLSPREQNFGGYAIGKLADSFSLDPSAAVPDADSLRVSLTGHTTLPMSVSIHYTVQCERTATRLQRWQIETYSAIHAAYLQLKSEYESWLAAQEGGGFINIEGRNPLLNREIEKRELKKYSISLLTGQQYESFNAMEEDHVSRIPQINLLDAAAEGEFVRFFEQALEWKHMTYLFYPYFWGNKKNWTSVMHQKDTDPVFEQFLQAGYARVWVPVRPGFDLVVANYVQSGGEPWTEKDAPLVEEPGDAPPFVSLIEEIKEQLGADFEFRAGSLQVVSGEDLVSGTGTDLTEDDVDREILIALRQYRIIAVDVANQTLRLGEPYEGESHDQVGFAIGVKFVGEPWLVQVPTTLVHLKGGVDPIVG